MKKSMLMLAILTGFFLASSCIYYVPYPEGDYPPPEEEYYEEEYPGYGARMDTSHFYDYLNPYGLWVYHRPYGYVWIPQSVGFGWRPYTHGRWAWTSHGWMWISFYDWGWAPFHYGRWGWDMSLGWFWVPGTVWGPAWVTWRYGSAFIGWAPLPPETRFIMGVGVTRLPYPLPDTYWIFVDGRHFLDHQVHRHVLPIERNYTIIKKTMIKTNIVHRDRVVVNEGIDVDTVGRMTSQRISRLELKDSEKPGPASAEAEAVRVYRPQVRSNERAKPKSVVSEAEAKDEVTRSRIKREEETARTDESWLRDEQTRETKILQESQESEVTRLRQERTVKIEEAQTQKEKEKVEKDYEGKLESTQNRHEAEKSLMKQRHQKEEQKVKETVKKKEAEKKEKKKEENKKKQTKAFGSSVKRRSQ